MPIDVSLIDIKNKRHVEVATNRSLSVNILPHDLPGKGQKNVFRYFSAKIGASGFDKGVTNMKVDGSATPQKFFGGADPDADIHIMALSILIADNNIAHNTFGQIPALANGWDIEVQEAGGITKLINKAKTGGEVILQAGAFWPYGNAGTTWELTSFTGNTDATLVTMPIHQMVPGGIRLGRGTFDKIESIINDDLTGLDFFEVRIYGFKHFPFVEARSAG